MSKRLGLTYIFLCALMWATMPLVFKFILAQVSTFTLIGISYLFATLSLFVLSLLIDRKSLFKALKGFRVITLLGGIILAFQYILFISGLNLTTALAAQILVQTETIYFVIWGFTFFQEKVTGKKIFGIGIAALGVFVVSWNGQDLSSLASSQYFAGNMMCLAGAFLFSIYMALQKRQSDRISGFMSLFPIFLISTVITLLLVPPDEVLGLDSFALGLMAAAGVITALSFLFFAKSLEHIQNSTISVVLASSPIITVAIVIVFKGMRFPFFAGEQLTAFILLGGAAIIFGAYTVISEER